MWADWKVWEDELSNSTFQDNMTSCWKMAYMYVSVVRLIPKLLSERAFILCPFRQVKQHNIFAILPRYLFHGGRKKKSAWAAGYLYGEKWWIRRQINYSINKGAEYLKVLAEEYTMEPYILIYPLSNYILALPYFPTNKWWYAAKTCYNNPINQYKPLLMLGVCCFPSSTQLWQEWAKEGN